MITLLFALLSIINVICLIIVAVHMAREMGLLIAVITVLCCQVFPFIWGWAFWRGNLKMLVMIIWTLSAIASGVLQLAYGEATGLPIRLV